MWADFLRHSVTCFPWRGDGNWGVGGTISSNLEPRLARKLRRRNGL